MEEYDSLPLSYLHEPYLNIDVYMDNSLIQSFCFTRIGEDCGGVPVVDGVCATCEIVKR